MSIVFYEKFGVFMKCSETEALMETYLDGGLDYKELEDFIDHIDSCDICKDDLEMRYIIKYGLSDEEDKLKGNYDFISHFKKNLEDAKQEIDDHKKNTFYRILVLLGVNSIMIITLIIMIMKRWLWISCY